MKETGKLGLTKQVTKFLQLVEGMYDICCYRNHQSLGSRKGRPDFEIILKYQGYACTIYIELKTGNNQLSPTQQLERERIRKAGGIYYICRSLENLVDIL